MGRVVCIDATGTGDVTQTHEVWRYDAVNVGYASPTTHAGHLYVVDNSANIHAVNADTGEVYWEHNIGKVGKGSPVWADGKLYVTEVNGGFVILQPSEDGCELLSAQEISRLEDEHYVEIYGSPAIADGRIYFTTEEHLYCIGRKE
jgi:outer membrane protein assembly factor BamB